MTAALIALAALAAQVEYSQPDTRPTVIELKDQTTIVGYPEQGWQNKENVTVDLDAPWQPARNRKAIVSVRNVERSWEERPSEWKARHERNWRERDYVNLGEGDTYYYLPRQEIELAERANKLATEPVDAVPAVPASGSPSPSSAQAPAEQSTPGFLTLWGPHLAIGAVTLLLAAGIVWALLVRTA